MTMPRIPAEPILAALKPLLPLGAPIQISLDIHVTKPEAEAAAEVADARPPDFEAAAVSDAAPVGAPVAPVGAADPPPDALPDPPPPDPPPDPPDVAGLVAEAESVPAAPPDPERDLEEAVAVSVPDAPPLDAAAAVAARMARAVIK